MNSCDSDDALTKWLEGFPRLAPDSDRAERVRMRCRTQLARSRERAARVATMTGYAWQRLPQLVVGGFCVFYVAAFVATAVRLHDVLR